jgi:hypothetical protein
MAEHPSPLDRLETRLDAQAARIDELYRLLHASPDRRKIAAPRRRPRRRRDRVAARP